MTTTSSLPAQSEAAFNPWLYAFSQFLMGATYLLILAGGLVTSHGAGLSVPDWPLSYGQMFPPMVGNIFWEHGHRMIAGTVGIFTLVQAVWIQAADKRCWMKRLGWIMAAMVVMQAVLGGMTVIYLLPVWISVFHACLAQTFFCFTVAASFFMSRAFLEAPPADPVLAGMRRLLFITGIFTFFQLVLGAAIRHSTMTAIPHMVGAAFVLIHVLLVVVRTMRQVPAGSLFFRNAVALGLVTLTQIFMGLGAYYFTRMIEQGYSPTAARVFFTAGHQTTGAAVFALVVLLNLEARR